MNIQLSVGMAPNPRTWPLFDGGVKPDGIDLIMSPVHASELFWRQLRFADFDLSDMSFSSLLIAIAHGDKRWIGFADLHHSPLIPYSNLGAAGCWH
jgi:4,5-dihydroxyphthalate decarboxylase